MEWCLGCVWGLGMGAVPAVGCGWCTHRFSGSGLGCGVGSGFPEPALGCVFSEKNSLGLERDRDYSLYIQK